MTESMCYRLFCCVSLLSLTHVSFAKDFELVMDWKNPTPQFSELKLDIETVANIIGKGQIIISHKQKDIELWSQGEKQRYNDIRFSSAMIIVDAPVDKVRQRVKNTSNYAHFMPQIRDSRITQSDKNHFLAAYTQHYNMGPFPLRAKFKWQHTMEDNGDISLLLHDGDIDAATGRYEFLPINEHQTLLVLTTWQDLSTAKLTYRMMIKANPDFESAFPAVAASILLLQYRDSFITEKNSKPEALPDKPKIPILTDNPEQLSTLIKLAKNGTLVLLGEKQWYRDKNYNNKKQSIVFASAIRIMNVDVEKAKPLILDMQSMQEFTKEIKKVEVSDIENGQHVQAKLKIGLGVIGISLDFYFDMLAHPDNENVRLLLNGGGDMYPMLGAYEFSGFQENGKDYTFGVLTQGGSISEQAPFMVKLIAKKLPQFDFIRTIFSTLPQIEKQQSWVMEQISKTDVIDDKK